MTFEPLLKPEPPWLLLHTPTKEEADLLPGWLYAAPGGSVVVRKLRGRKMRTRQALMDEFGAALQFFDGFGDNWNALRECLGYLDEWLPASGYILVISRPSEVLVGESEGELHSLLNALEATGEWWSRPIEGNGRFDRPALPFHSIFQAEPEEVDRLPPRLAALSQLRGT